MVQHGECILKKSEEKLFPPFESKTKHQRKLLFWVWVCACVRNVLWCEQCNDILNSNWLLYSGVLSVCVRVCAFMCAAQWHFDHRWLFCAFKSAYEFHPPGGDRIGHTEWLTFHLPAPPQCPQVVPICHGDESRWVSFMWKIGLWGVEGALF